MEKLDKNSGTPIGDNLVKHPGLISKISKNSVTVYFLGNINCVACNAKSACGISESGAKEIEIFGNNQEFVLNEIVAVVMKKSLGLKAVLWTYVFPFLLMFLTLIISISFFAEWLAGLFSLLILIPYYLTIYFFRNTFKNVFKFYIQTKN
ncbi:MAG TPA: SoxR reducing system RseC family protein [Lutibacter sp.]|nr:SoxR reducing system RseC family protein [Lutibacter sp.]